MVDVVIRGARVWSELGIRVADVALEAGEIVDVGSVPRGAGTEFDATGLLLLPGLIDDHVHFREPGREDKEDFATGSQAAAHGGVTTIIEIQNNAPLMTSRAAVEAKLALVRPKSRVNVGIYGSATAASLGKLGEMADYVLGYKIFLAPSHGDAGVDSDEMLRSLYREAARAGRPVVVHAEDKATIEKGLAQFSTDGPRGWSRARSPAAEVLAVERALRLCEETGARTHVFHLSAAGSVDRLADAKAKGLPVTGATCPHYLLFTDDDVARVGGLLKVNPSIKGAVDRARLREGVRDGTIDVLETDHAPHLPTEKTAPFNDNPSGHFVGRRVLAGAAEAGRRRSPHARPGHRAGVPRPRSAVRDREQGEHRSRFRRGLGADRRSHAVVAKQRRVPVEGETVALRRLRVPRARGAHVRRRASRVRSVTRARALRRQRPRVNPSLRGVDLRPNRQGVRGGTPVAQRPTS
jgi:dihydroorotase (multifunctional complex type)